MKTTIENIQIAYEDNHIIIVNKRAGDIVQGDKTGDTPLSDLLKLYVKVKFNKPGNVFLGVIHRLDRPTSGLVAFARTSKGLTRMTELFKKREITKTYWAIVKNKPKNDIGTLVHYLKKNSKNNKSTAFDKEIEGSKKAVLHYKLIASSDKYYLLEINLETGRHHQIRAQLAKISSPIKGDLKYGFARSNRNAGISLHARTIAFEHPIKKEAISVMAPTPTDDIWHFFEIE
jgi:23S rRNA pseudouridine1911/1915/1917 synthase